MEVVMITGAIGRRGPGRCPSVRAARKEVEALDSITRRGHAAGTLFITHGDALATFAAAVVLSARLALLTLAV
jgi:hypothetical protein